MKYTKYFGLIVKTQGLINLNPTQFKRMMNIVHIEGSIYGLHKAKEANKNTPDYNKFYMIIFNEGKRLTELTGNVDPEVLIQEMVKLSD